MTAEAFHLLPKQTVSAERPKGHRDQMFFKLLHTCGLRVGEADRVRVSDINWEEGWLRLTGKEDKERRVYLKPYPVDALKEYIEESEAQGYLFGGRDGQNHIRCLHMSRRLNRDRGVRGDTERGRWGGKGMKGQEAEEQERREDKGIIPRLSPRLSCCRERPFQSRGLRKAGWGG